MTITLQINIDFLNQYCKDIFHYKNDNINNNNNNNNRFTDLFLVMCKRVSSRQYFCIYVENI